MEVELIVLLVSVSSEPGSFYNERMEVNMASREYLIPSIGLNLVSILLKLDIAEVMSFLDLFNIFSPPNCSFFFCV